MKNACKHFALCTLTLILCLALAACGSDNSGDSADYGNDSTVPSTIDGFVKESYDSYGSCSQVHNVTYGAGRTVRGRK